MKSASKFLNDLVWGNLSEEEMRNEIVEQIINGSKNDRDFEIALQYRLVKELEDINKNIESLINVIASEP